MQSSLRKLFDKWIKEHEEEKKVLEPFFKAFGRESDRTIGIVSACLLDSLLESLIKASYIKDPNVNRIFKDEHVLQSFYTKINIAYFSGLIPKGFYHNLKLINEIRNKFAHNVVADIQFSDEIIVRRIDRFAHIPKELVKVYPPRLRFDLIVSHIIGFLEAMIKVLSTMRPPTIVEMLKFKEKEKRFEEMILTPNRILDIIKSKTKDKATD